MSKKILHIALLLLIGLLLLIVSSIHPLHYAQSSDFRKFLFFGYGCLVVLGVWGVSIFFSKLKEIAISKLDLSLGFLFVYITINRYFLQEDFGFSIRYFELLGLAMLYVVLRTLSPQKYTGLLLAMTISGIVQAGYGNLQLLGYCTSNHSGFKMTGSFFNPGPYAGFLSVVWPIALGLYLFKEKIIKREELPFKTPFKLIKKGVVYLFEYLPFLGVISSLLVLPASSSRAAWLAIAVSSGCLLEWRYHFLAVLKRQSRLKKGLFTGISLLVVLGVLSSVYYFKKESADGRLLIWKVTSEMIRDFPILGVGFDQFKAHYMETQADYFAERGETQEAFVADNCYYAFNEGLQFWAEEGILGLLFLIGVFLSVIKISVSKHNQVFYLLILGVLSSAIVFACFSYPMQILPFKLVVLFCLGFLATLDEKKYRPKVSQRKTLPFFGKSIIGILLILVLLKTTIGLQKLDGALQDWRQALLTYQYGDYQGAVEDYEKAYPILKKEGSFLMNYGKALAINKKSKEAIAVLTEAKQYLNTTIIETALGDAYRQLKEYDRAEIAYRRAYEMIPVRFYPLYLLANLYEETGQRDKAVAMAKVVLNKKVKVPSTAIKEIKTEMQKLLEKQKEK